MLHLPGVVHHGGDLVVGVAQPGAELLAAAVLLDEVQPEGPGPLLLVDVGHGAHVGAQDDLGVVLEEVDLEQKNNVDGRLFENIVFSLICRSS